MWTYHCEGTHPVLPTSLSATLPKACPCSLTQTHIQLGEVGLHYTYNNDNCGRNSTWSLQKNYMIPAYTVDMTMKGMVSNHQYLGGGETQCLHWSGYIGMGMKQVTQDRRSGPLEPRMWKRRLNTTWTNRNCRSWKWLQYKGRKPHRGNHETVEEPETVHIHKDDEHRKMKIG